jgi:hypothetical protein
MKQLKRNLFAISIVSLCLSTQVFASGAKRPELEEGEVTETETPTTPSNPQTPTTPPTNPTTPTTPLPSGAYVEHITSIVASSTSCLNYAWSNRGKAPSGYIKGMALTYARSFCRLKANEQSPSSLAALLSAAKGLATKDALAHYSTTFSNLGISNTTAGQVPLKSLYTLGIGLGMRESSGRYCEGWDRSASSSRPSTAGEAGLFQTSYDSMGVSSELSKLYAEYKANPNACFLNTYKVGVSCSSTDMSNLGTGTGADFQSFLKSCPGFAAEYAMITLRVLRQHYGPINRMEAEVNSSCNQMLTKVQDFINEDPNACQDLI